MACKNEDKLWDQGKKACLGVRPYLGLGLTEKNSQIALSLELRMVDKLKAHRYYGLGIEALPSKLPKIL